MPGFFIRFLSVLTLYLCLQGTALAGVVFEVEVKDHESSPPAVETMHMYAEGRNLKMEIIPGSGTKTKKKNDEMVYRADRKEMVVFDHRNKEYSVINEAFMKNMRKRMASIGGQMANLGGVGNMGDMMKHAYEAAAAQIDAQNLSPAEAAAAKQSLRRTMGMSSLPAQKNDHSLKIKKGRKGKANGYPVVSYESFRGKEKVEELKVAKWKDLGAGAKAKDSIESYFKFFSEMTKGNNKMGFGSGKNPNFFEAMEKIDGFPVVTRSFEGGELEQETVLKSVTERDLDPDAFEPPKGYRLRTMGPNF